MPYYMYILYSRKLDKYYTGYCEDLDVRLLQHNTGRNTSTKPGMPWQIVYKEIHETRQAAVAREKEIKSKKSRKYIKWLIDKST